MSENKSDEQPQQQQIPLQTAINNFINGLTQADVEVGDGGEDELTNDTIDQLNDLLDSYNEDDIQQLDIVFSRPDNVTGVNTPDNSIYINLVNDYVIQYMSERDIDDLDNQMREDMRDEEQGSFDDQANDDEEKSDDANNIGSGLSFKKYKNVNDLLKAFDKQERELRGGAVNLDDAKRYLDKGVTFAKWANRVWEGVQKYPNERHYPMYVDGKIKMANYMGSGTQLLKRLKDGDEPISYVDKISQLHDMMYQKAALSNTREEMRAKKREADLEMINLLNLAKEFRLDNRVNVGIAKIGIEGKMKIENILPSFITDKLGDEFTGDLEQLPEEDVVFLDNEKERVVNELYNKVNEQRERFQQNQPQQEQEDIQGGSFNKHMEMFKIRQRPNLYFR